MPVTLILGGARSGKSRRAECLARDSGLSPVYLATAPRLPDDDEWRQRLLHHRARRGDDWRTVEEETALVETLPDIVSPDCIVVVDCLTLWLSNLMHAGIEPVRETDKLCALLPELDGGIMLVSNEVGMGLVPETPLGRAFRDAQGRLNQRVAAVADRVEFVAAGLPLLLKEKNGT